MSECNIRLQGYTGKGYTKSPNSLLNDYRVSDKAFRLYEILLDAQFKGRFSTQEYLANMTGVNISHVSNIETGKTKVSLTLLVQICNALDVTLDYLLENEYHNPTSTIEKELLNTIKDMKKEKQETLLRIAKVL